MRRHRVTFYSPGTFVSELSELPIDSWDTKTAVEMSKSIIERYNARPFAFVFSTVVTVDPVPDGEGGTLDVLPREVERSGYYFLGGRIESYSDVLARNDPKESILRSNMRGNGMWFVVVNDNSFRSTMPFDKKDCVVDANGVVVERGDSLWRVAYRILMDQDRKAEFKREMSS